MYIPPSFRITDAKKLADFMSANSFATVVSFDGGRPFASHLPVRHFATENGAFLISHMARTNPQWRHFTPEQEVLTIFQGPHSYISPSWYSTSEAVPTWNYASVHAYGIPSVFNDHERVVALLAETVEFYERSFTRPWPGILPEEFRDKLIHAIVAFEIRLTDVEGKFKLGQNRSLDDIHGVYHALATSGSPSSRDLASLMASEGLLGNRGPS
jgi:transcriptional regulator